jgi:hypothetical protein
MFIPKELRSSGFAYPKLAGLETMKWYLYRDKDKMNRESSEETNFFHLPFIEWLFIWLTLIKWSPPKKEMGEWRKGNLGFRKWSWLFSMWRRCVKVTYGNDRKGEKGVVDELDLIRLTEGLSLVSRWCSLDTKAKAKRLECFFGLNLF